MKKIRGWMLAGLVLCAVMLIGLLPGTAAKAELGKGVLFVGETDIVDFNNTVAGGSGGTATLSYDTDGNPVLTLNNFKDSGPGHIKYDENHFTLLFESSLYYFGEKRLTLILNGDNEIKNTGTGPALSYGIKLEKANLIITGGGSLTVSSGYTGISVDSGTITINNVANLQASGGKFGIDSHGISIENSTVTSKGAENYGITVNGSVTIKNSALNVEGKTYGLYIESGELAISGKSTVTATLTEQNRSNAPIVARSGMSLTGVYISVPAEGEFIQKGTGRMYRVYDPDGESATSVKIEPFPEGKYRLVYNAGDGGSGHMNSKWVAENDPYEFPECTFTAPESKKFYYWEMSGADGFYSEGTTVNNAPNCVQDGVITVTAHWKYAAEASVSTAPEATEPTYNGAGQALVTAGMAEDGTMKYALGTDSTTAPTSGWSTEIPKGTQVGTWYVWYKAAGDETHSDSAPGCCTAKIKKAPLTVTANAKTITYGDAPANNGAAYSGFVNNETAAVLGGELAYEYSYAQYGDVGSYTITPKGLSADNYDISYTAGTLTVEQKEVIVVPMTTTFTYNGKIQVPTAKVSLLVNNDKVTVEILDGAIDANLHKAVIGRLIGDKAGNYKLGGVNIYFEIIKATPVVTAPKAKEGLPCTGSAQELVTAGSTDDGTLQYALGTDETTVPENGWSTAIPTGTDAGTYYVWYKVVGDKNHLDSEPACVTAVINAQKPSYYAASGQGAEWQRRDDGALTFIFRRTEDDTATFDHFTGIACDGRAVPERDASGRANWTAGSGSLILTLNPSFLETLPAGNHTVTAVFDDGTASASFTVSENLPEPTVTSVPEPTATSAPAPEPTETPKPVPKTGDGGQPVFWICLILLGIAGLAVPGVKKFSRKRK